MFENAEYIKRGYNYLRNKAMPHKKVLSSLMIYATDVCDSACKHCLIWAKRPAHYLSVDSIVKVMQSNCVHPSTSVGLEGGEFCFTLSQTKYFAGSVKTTGTLIFFELP